VHDRLTSAISKLLSRGGEKDTGNLRDGRGCDQTDLSVWHTQQETSPLIEAHPALSP
jgi:hypothetical protein